MSSSDDENPLAEVYDEDNLLDMVIPPKPELCMKTDGSGARLMIKEIVVTNFKSYYGTQKIGPFHKNFSAIVGPNGSGKSNVIDSLLFVFGYKASKIRSKRLSVLIHSSSGKDNINSCTVEILFQKIIDKDGGDFDVVPGSEFSVSRTAYKNNSSTYTMNGKIMSIKEIAKHLREVGIDLVHNRFLILQGEVEQIAMMKPKALNSNDEGMLEYLEDIIGSSRFKMPIENIGEKLNKLSAERSQQTQRVKAAEKEKQAMEGPVRELISFFRIENQVALIKNKLFHIKMFKFSLQISKMQPERDSLEKEKETVEAELKELLEFRKIKDTDIHKIEGEKDKAIRELEKVQRELTDLEGRETKRKNDLKRASVDLTKLMNDLEKEKKKLNDIQSIPEKSAAKIEVLRESITELYEIEDKNQKKVDENLPKFEKETMGDKAKKAILEEELGVLKQAENDASSKLTLAQEELQILMADEQKEKRRLYDLSTQLNDAKELLEKKSTEYADVKAALPKSQDALRLAREQVPLIKEEEDKLADDVSQLRMKLADEKLAASHGMQGSERHKALMKAKSGGILPGLLGRLGDLGGIDKKYDAAISTTTAALDSYVVETTNDGHAAIDFLVKNNFGRTNFITIDKTSEYKGSMDPPTSKKFPALRLFDLLEISDSRLRKVFYSTLLDTMVVETLKEAQDISDKYLGSRIVTLQGQVIDSSGTVSGGGSPKYGLIGNKVKVDTTKETKDTAERIARYSKELDEKTAKLQEITSRMRQTEQRIYTLSNDVNKLNTQNRILSNEVQVLEAKISNLQKQLEDQQEQADRCVADEVIVQAKTGEINRLTQLRNKANEDVDAVQVKVDEVQSRIDAIHKDLIKKYADEVQLARERRSQAEKDVAKEQSSINAASRNHRKAEERIAQIEKDYSDKKAIEEKLSDDEGLFTKEILRLHSKKKELEVNVNEMEDLLKEARKKNSSMDQDELRLQKTIKEFSEKIEEIDCQLKALSSELAGIKKQIASLKLNRIKELGILPEKIRQRDEEEYYLDETVREEEEHLKKQKERQGDMDDEVDDGALPVLTEEHVKDVDREDLKFQLTSLEQKLSANKKDINMNIIQDFTVKVKRFEHERELLDVAKKKYNDHLTFQDNLKKQRLNEFMEGFERIGLALKEMYQMITLGGDAALDLKDSMDPFSEGIQFMVRPPKKSWKNIENLSGGEKTLSSLSLVFALHHYRPTPLYVMDEIDAALDFRNVSIIGHYIKDRTKNAQFIIISLRNNMFELGDRLIGIYKTFDCTKNVVIDPAQVIDESKKITKALETVCKDKENHPYGEEKSYEGVDEAERLDHNRKVRSSSSEISLPRKRVSAGSPPSTIGKKPDHRPSPKSSKKVCDREVEY